ncbi:hypothetical protein AB0Y20_00725 [Heyndrickxia oleronia]|uniref:hypothetical protein n=1 Tax=Heyndrickxia oleronia TaxID=38875 RepID=UPI003F211E7A
MDEKQYIYSRLKYLSDELELITTTVEDLINLQEEVANTVKLLVDRMDEISSPEYLKKINKYNDTLDVMEKIKYIRSLKR